MQCTMKKTNLLFIAAFIYLKSVHAQSPDWLWAKSLGGTDDDRATSLVVDAAGNVYATGWFLGTVDFDPGEGAFNLTSVAGSSDIFVLKLDASGNFVWAKAMGGATNDAGYSLTIDAVGNVF